jgi:hypothetical protein
MNMKRMIQVMIVAVLVLVAALAGAADQTSMIASRCPTTSINSFRATPVTIVMNGKPLGEYLQLSGSVAQPFWHEALVDCVGKIAGMGRVYDTIIDSYQGGGGDAGQ